MENLENLYKRLEEYSDFEIEENCEKFLDTVDSIVLQKDPSSIKILLSYFDDKSDYDWIINCIRKSIEYYPQQMYVIEVINNIGFMLERAPLWLDEIINSILNEKSDLDLFINNMHLISNENMLKLFDIIEKESPHHKMLVEILRKEFHQK